MHYIVCTAYYIVRKTYYLAIRRCNYNLPSRTYDIVKIILFATNIFCTYAFNSDKIYFVERLLTPLIPPFISHNGVSFYAYISSKLSSPSTEHVLVFDVAKTNLGNAYHPNTGVFIVPESGVYVFTWTFRIGAINDHSIELILNREDVGTVYLNTIDGVDAEATGIVMIVVEHVNAGDDVFVRTHPQLQIGTGHYINSNTFGRSSFAGWKIF